jgi:sugar lactone lactonase YvrE
MEAGVGPCVVPALWNQQTHRLNDGRADRAGRFWVGSMHDTDFTAPDGSLYSFASGGRTHVYETGIIIPNSIAFSPDDRWFYFADTRRYVIWQYAFDLADGQLSNRTVFAEFGNGPARPDGSCMDATGCLWNASYEGARITRFTPTGAVDREIALPVSFPTCVALGGDALDTLFITTAVGPVPYARRAQEPLAGGLFAVNAGVVGLPEPAVGL